MASKKSQTNLSAAASARLKAFEAKQQLQNSKADRRKRDNRLAVIASVVVVALALGSQLVFYSFGPGHVTPSPTASLSAAQACLNEPAPATGAKTAAPTKAPAVSVAEKRAWTGSMYVNGCKLAITVDGVKAPHAAANFIALAKSGFYNNVSCHRLTTQGIFVLQCGDPKGDGTGGPGYSFGPNNENAPAVAKGAASATYAKGVLAMANSGGTATQGSQFFIVYTDSPLAPNYSVFGSVTSGIESISALAALGVTGTKPGDGGPKVATKLGPIVLQ